MPPVARACSPITLPGWQSRSRCSLPITPPQLIALERHTSRTLKRLFAQFLNRLGLYQ